jgi:hypothetical protein
MAEWTDERMDDLAAQMAAGFDRTDRAIGELRGDVSALRTDLEREIKGVRTELKGDIHSLRTEFKSDIEGLRTELKGDIQDLRTELKGDIAVLHAMMFRFCLVAILGMAGFATALIGVLVAGPG